MVARQMVARQMVTRQMAARVMVTRLVLAGLLASLVAGALFAQERDTVEVAALGPQIGEQVPDFRLPDQNGRYHTLQDIMGPNGAMLLFHRSADW